MVLIFSWELVRADWSYLYVRYVFNSTVLINRRASARSSGETIMAWRISQTSVVAFDVVGGVVGGRCHTDWAQHTKSHVFYNTVLSWIWPCCTIAIVS